MKIVVPGESARKRFKARRRRHVSLGAWASIALAMTAIGLFLWPGGRGKDLYMTVDGQVAGSLFQFREDHGLRRLDVGGKIWSYQSTGDGSDAVVLLHGFGSGPDVWWQQMKALEAGRTLIAVTYPDIQSLEEAAGGVRSILEEEGIARAHVVGADMGGLIAQFFAALYPERVASVVLSNTFLPGDWIRSYAASRGRLLGVTPDWAIRTGLMKDVRSTLVPASGNSALVRDYFIEQASRMDRATVRGHLALLQQAFEAPDLGSAGIPTLIIESSNDPIVPAAQREAVRAAYPSARSVDLGEAGHVPHLNRPAGYTRELERFLGVPTDWAPEAPEPDSLRGTEPLLGAHGS